MFLCRSQFIGMAQCGLNTDTVTIFRYKANGKLYVIESVQQKSWTEAVLYATPYKHDVWIGYNLKLDDFIAVSET